MSLRNKLISLLGGTPKPEPVEYKGSMTLPPDHPLSKMLAEHLGSGQPGILTIPKDSPEGEAIRRAIESGHDQTRRDALDQLGGDHQGNFISWEVWDRERRILTADLPGWSACRFFNRISLTDARGVFGAVKGDFGIWRQPFNTCNEAAAEPEDIISKGVVLPLVTYLPTGLQLAIFADVPTAAKAVEVAASIDWSNLPPCDDNDGSRKAWREHMIRVKTMWDYAGISPSLTTHAHDPMDGEEVPILTLQDLARGKPEKLS